MNRSAEIIEYLTQTDESHGLVIAPKAPPIDRTRDGVKIALSRVLDAGDVNDTLAALYDRSYLDAGVDRAPAGTFSFGVAGTGRFRVSYVTQRGSRVVSVARISTRIPVLEDVLAAPAAAAHLLALLHTPERGCVLFSGANARANNNLVYALLGHLNGTERTVVICLERVLSYLMSHNNSIVIQSEIGTDVPSLPAGIETGLLMMPNYLYVGDVLAHDDAQSVRRAIEAGVFVLCSSSSMTDDQFLNKIAPVTTMAAGGLKNRVRAFVRVAAQDDDPYRIVVDIDENAGHARTTKAGPGETGES